MRCNGDGSGYNGGCGFGDWDGQRWNTGHVIGGSDGSGCSGGGDIYRVGDGQGEVH